MYMETCVQRPQVCVHTVSEHKSACTLLHFFLKLEFAFVYSLKPAWCRNVPLPRIGLKLYYSHLIIAIIIIMVAVLKWLVAICPFNFEASC